MNSDTEQWTPPDCSRLVSKVVLWRTRMDGQLHESEELAWIHCEGLAEADHMTDLLKAGETIADILRSVGRPISNSALERISRATPIVISCQPAAYCCHFERFDKIHVRSPHGGFEASLSLPDLARLAVLL